MNSIDFTTTMMAMVAMVLYVIVYISIVNLLREKRAKSKNDFFKALKEGLKTGAITTLDDAVNIYKGITGLGSEDLDSQYNLSKLLREFLVNLISKNKSVIDDDINDEMIREWKQKLTDFISKNEVISPYADLPAAERNILSDISTFIEKDDMESVNRKILELSGMIQARNDDLNRIRNINKWAVPLSAIGLILTIIFGVLVWIK